MSLLVASIIASTAYSLYQNSEAEKAQKEADKMAKYQDLIDIEVQAQTDYISKQNQTRGLTSVESSQTAQSAQMGKRGSASVNNMQAIAREDMALNFERMDSGLEMSKQAVEVNAKARESASKAQADANDLGLVTSVIRNGLMLAGK